MTPARRGMVATVMLSGYPDPILVKVGSVDQDNTVLHILDKVHHIGLHRSNTLTIPCRDGRLGPRWQFEPLPGA